MFKPLRTAAAALALLGSAAGSQALTFDLSFTPGTTAQEQASFIAAAAMWSAVFSDPVTVKLTVGTAALPSGVLAQAGSRRLNYSYGDIYSALAGDASSALDATAVANLDSDGSFGMLINRVSDNPNGATSFTPFLDDDGSANNSQIRLSAANARALGLSFGVGGVGSACSDCDAFIQFSTGFSWDHERSDGIDGSSFDFIGVAAHEIGHALGMISGVDVLDANGNGSFSSNQFTFVSTMDLFRWSSASAAAGVIDWSAGPADKCFSVDKGAHCGPLFSTGATLGDGRQASHWKDNLGIGIMDPTSGRGELLAISQNDLNAFDAVGWNLAAIPEPETYALMALGLGVVGGVARRRKA